MRKLEIKIEESLENQRHIITLLTRKVITNEFFISSVELEIELLNMNDTLKDET